MPRLTWLPLPRIATLASTALLLAVLFAAPPRARAIDLTTEDGHLFDIQDTSDGSVLYGTDGAYNGCYRLIVNASPYNARGSAATMTLGGRGIDMAEVSIGTLRVQRHVYVPATGGEYVRYVDVISNVGVTSVAATIQITGNLGGGFGFGTRLVSDSSGDARFDMADQWFTTDDAGLGASPVLGHVMQGDSPRVPASAASYMFDAVSWTFSTSIPAGERVAIVTYAVQVDVEADARAEAMRLSALPDDALTGAEEFYEDIINFPGPPPGAPHIAFSGPVEAEEGSEAMVTVDVTDLEGDTPTWSWDTDGDGTFGELVGMTSYTVPAGTTDGTSSLRIGVSATDGTNTFERYRAIRILNVAPIVTSTAITTTSVLAMYRYPLEVTEPAGALDPLTYTVMTGPSGMSVSTMGVVTWTPDESDITMPGESIPVVIQIDDGDMGVTTHSYDLMVSPNRLPTLPSPVYPVGGIGLVERMPRLVAQNAMDPDLDPLTYFFEIDTVDTFDSPAKISSGPVVETPGFSFWYTTAPLSPGRYFWRVWVNDGTADTEPRGDSFFEVPIGVATDGGVPDAGTIGVRDGGATPPPPDDGGCSIARGNQGLGATLLGLVPLAWLVRRRRAAHRAERADRRR